jgi:hypothetical protein
MATVIPVLSTSTVDTFLSSPLVKGRRILINYLLTDRWQSHSYNTTIISAVDILLEHTDDHEAMREAVLKSLQKLYGLHFEKADIDVSVNLEERALDIGVTWFENGIPYSYAMTGVEFDKILGHVVNEHNYGEPFSTYPMPDETY